MNKKFGTDLSVGSIPRHLLRFSVPMLIGNFIQVGNNIVNTVWVGHLIGENAVGAIGVSFPVFFILLGFALGMSSATTIIVSQYYGAKDFAMVKRAVNNSFTITLMIGIGLAVAGIFACDSILKFMGTPPENFAMASSYLKIIMFSFIPMYLLQLTSSILRGIGDTVTPLLFMAVSIGINALLDPILIGGFGPFPSHGLDGAAYASLIAWTIALIMSVIYLNRKDHIVAFNPKKLTFDGHITALIFKLGFPSIIQQSLISLGSIFILSFVNAYGAAATNAFGAFGRVDMVIIMPAMSVSMAATTLTGQNLGAGKPQRVKDIFKWGVIMTSIITICISLVVIVFAKYIFIMFGIGSDTKAVEIGVQYFHIVYPFFVFMAILFVSNGIINGAGHTLITMFLSIMSLYLVRVPFSWFFTKKTSLGINGIWIAVAMSMVFTMCVSLAYYFSGRWKKSVVLKTPVGTPFME
jgi:putative MATE family efflux protein